MIELKKGNYFKFYKPKLVLRIYGQILEKDKRYYKFRVLASNRPGLLNRTGSFLLNGNVSKYTTKVSKKDMKYGLLE